MKKNTKFIMIYIIGLFITAELFAHGYVTSPVARQISCAKDGGYWSSQDGSSIPNIACRNAFLQSGTYPFIQGNEFATLIAQPNYDNMDIVKEKVQDGLLCSGGSDTNKEGFDLASPYWKKTQIVPGEPFEYTLKATAPHQPSFIQIYITNNGFNSATQQLTWDDLELIHEDNVIFEGGLYKTNITIPVKYTGANAILYTRWQRIDPAGEGFYNCSDVALSSTPIQETTDDSNSAAEDNPDNSSETENRLVAKASARPHIITGEGKIVLSASESDNNSPSLTYQWTQIGGSEVEIVNPNAEYTDVNLGAVNSETAYTFKVTISDGNMTDETNVSVTQYPKENNEQNNANENQTNDTQTSDNQNQNSDGSITVEYTYPDGLGNYAAHTVVKAKDSDNIYKCKPFPYSGWCNGSGFYYAPETGLAWKQAWVKVEGVAVDNGDTTNENVETNTSTDTDTSTNTDTSTETNTSNQTQANNDTNNSCASGEGIGNWSASNVYLGGSVVKHNRKYYKAKWWTQNNEPPKTVPNPPWSSPWIFLGNCAPFIDADSTASISHDEAQESTMGSSDLLPPIVVDTNDTETQEQATQAAGQVTENTDTPVVPPVIAGEVPEAIGVTEEAPQTLPDGGYEFLRLLTNEDWDWLFPLRSGKYVSTAPCAAGQFLNCGGGARNQPPIALEDGSKDTFTLSAFIKATLAYNTWAKVNNYKQFLNEGTLTQQAQEFAAFWAKSSRETSGSWATASEPWIVDDTVGDENLVVWKGGLYWVEEVGYSTNPDGTSASINYVDSGSSLYPPVAGRSYYGRGPIQLSWNYNYGAFSHWLYDNGLLPDIITEKNILLEFPNLVAENGTLATLSGIWFWMTPQGAKPSSHDVILGDVSNISQRTQDRGLPQTNQVGYTPQTSSGYTTNQEVLAYRLGTITNIVNGGLECNKAAKWHHGPVQRAYYYDTYTAYLNDKHDLQITRLDDVKASSRAAWNGSISDSSSNILQSATCYNQKSYYGW